MNSTIEARNLSFSYNSKIAIEDLSFSVDLTCGCVGILGKNGAGKTTFLKLLTGLLTPKAGSLHVNLDAKSYKHVGPDIAFFISEYDSTIPTLTGIQQIELYNSLNGLVGVSTDKDLQKKIINQLNLKEHLNKRISSMSKGTRRKIEIVVAISTCTPLIVTDELTEGLDINSRMALEALIKDCVRCGKKFIISSHDMAFVGSVCKKAILFDRGKLLGEFNVDSSLDLFKKNICDAFGISNESSALIDNGILTEFNNND